MTGRGPAGQERLGAEDRPESLGLFLGAGIIDDFTSLPVIFQIFYTTYKKTINFIF